MRNVATPIHSGPLGWGNFEARRKSWYPLPKCGQEVYCSHEEFIFRHLVFPSPLTQGLDKLSPSSIEVTLDCVSCFSRHHGCGRFSVRGYSTVVDDEEKSRGTGTVLSSRKRKLFPGQGEVIFFKDEEKVSLGGKWLPSLRREKIPCACREIDYSMPRPRAREFSYPPSSWRKQSLR